MAVKLDTQDIARIITIDGTQVAFTSEDLIFARIHADKVSARGGLKKEDLEKWYADGSPDYEIEEKAKRESTSVNNSNEVVANLVARKLDKSGKLTKHEVQIPITRAAVREYRGKIRGRYSSEQLFGSIVDKITDDLAPIEIVEVDETVHSITEENGSWVATRNKDRTDDNLKNKNLVLIQRIEELERIISERKDS